MKPFMSSEMKALSLSPRHFLAISLSMELIEPYSWGNTSSMKASK
jgi:hypothetical protein